MDVSSSASFRVFPCASVARRTLSRVNSRIESAANRIQCADEPRKPTVVMSSTRRALLASGRNPGALRHSTNSQPANTSPMPLAKPSSPSIKIEGVEHADDGE